MGQVAWVECVFDTVHYFRLMMFAGAFFSMMGGAGIPAFARLFGNVMTSLAIAEPVAQKSAVLQDALHFLILGGILCIAHCCTNAFFIISAERQSSRLKNEYLRALLRQDVEYVDQRQAHGSLISQMTEDMDLFHRGIARKLSDLCYHTAVVL